MPQKDNAKSPTSVGLLSSARADLLHALRQPVRFIFQRGCTAAGEKADAGIIVAFSQGAAQFAHADAQVFQRLPAGASDKWV